MRPVRLLLVSLLVAIALCPVGLAGTSMALAKVRPGDTGAAVPATIYASVTGAGAFKSTNLAGSWVGPDALPSSPLALAGGDPAHWRDVYAGLRDGVYVSHDGGNTWTQTLRVRMVNTLLVLAQSPNTVLAGTNRGIYVSANGGVTWVLGGVSRPITALAQQGNSAVLYAGGHGWAWVSRDGGQNWTPLSGGLPSSVTITGLAVNSSGTAYAATTAGLWQSTGSVTATWTLLRQGLPSSGFTAVLADATHLYAAPSSGSALYVSADGGTTWTADPIAGLTGSITALAEDSQQAGTLAMGDANGLVRVSTDGGSTWSTPSGTVAGTVGSPIQALTIVHRQPLPVDGVADPHQAGVLYVASNGGHTLSGPFLAFWQAHRDVTGDPETEPFADPAHGGARAQYFENMELLQQGDTVVPAPLGLESLPAAYTGKGSYTIDAHFMAFWSAHGGSAVFGPPVSPAFRQSFNDGSGRSYLVQYFRNARLEYHPEYQGGGDVVRVGQLGVQALQAMGWL